MGFREDEVGELNMYGPTDARNAMVLGIKGGSVFSN